MKTYRVEANTEYRVVDNHQLAGVILVLEVIICSVHNLRVVALKGFGNALSSGVTFKAQ